MVFQVDNLKNKSEIRISKSLAQTWSTGATASCGYVAPGQAETNPKFKCLNVQNSIYAVCYC